MVVDGMMNETLSNNGLDWDGFDSLPEEQQDTTVYTTPTTQGNKEATREIRIWNKKGTRNKNFSEVDDVVLIRAWLDILFALLFVIICSPGYQIFWNGCIICTSVCDQSFALLDIKYFEMYNAICYDLLDINCWSISVQYAWVPSILVALRCSFEGEVCSGL
jgi:hypothetical protein